MDGFEFDYEGPSTAAAADVFTQLLIDIKATVCAQNSEVEGTTNDSSSRRRRHMYSHSLKDCGFVISADSEPPQWSDYFRLNASKMDGVNIDYVNYMSYFDGSPSGDISRWNASISMLLEQGYPASTISLAIPYFFGACVCRHALNAFIFLSIGSGCYLHTATLLCTPCHNCCRFAAVNTRWLACLPACYQKTLRGQTSADPALISHRHPITAVARSSSASL